jgi:hypothetical protein
LYFLSDELDPKGTIHNKLLYIIVKCKDYVIAKMLINNGLALNILPRHILDCLPVDALYMRLSIMMARAYDGSLR